MVVGNCATLGYSIGRVYRVGGFCDCGRDLRGDEVKSLMIRLTGKKQVDYAAKMINECLDQPELWCVDIKKAQKDRKASQNRLQHHWNNEIHEVRNQVKDYPVNTLGELRAFNKLRFGVPILLADEDFNKVWRMTTGHLNYQAIMEFIEVTDFPVTRLMNVKQMTMFLSDVKTFWNLEGVNLTTSEDFYFEAMGLKK